MAAAALSPFIATSVADFAELFNTQRPGDYSAFISTLTACLDRLIPMVPAGIPIAITLTVKNRPFYLLTSGRASAESIIDQDALRPLFSAFLTEFSKIFDRADGMLRIIAGTYMHEYSFGIVRVAHDGSAVAVDRGSALEGVLAGVSAFPAAGAGVAVPVAASYERELKKMKAKSDEHYEALQAKTKELESLQASYKDITFKLAQLASLRSSAAPKKGGEAVDDISLKELVNLLDKLIKEAKNKTASGASKPVASETEESIALKREIAALEARIARFTESEPKLISALETAEAERDRLNVEVAKLSEQIATEHAARASLELADKERARAYANLLDRANKEIAALRLEVEHLRSTLTEHETFVDAASKIATSAEARAAGLDKYLTTIEAKCARLEAENEALRAAPKAAFDEAYRSIAAEYVALGREVLARFPRPAPSVGAAQPAGGAGAGAGATNASTFAARTFDPSNYPSTGSTAIHRR